MASTSGLRALLGYPRLGHGALAAFLGSSGLMLSTQTPAAADAPPGALNPKEFIPLVLMDKTLLTKDTYQFRFALPEGQVAGGGVASCIVTRAMLKAKPEDAEAKPVIRPYTPTSSKDARGYLDLVVKVYPSGMISKHMGSMEVGDTLDIKGPIPKLAVTPNMKKHLAMVAGGTGITPMLQVIEEVLADPTDTTQLSLMYASHTQEDIILKKRIDRLARSHPGRFKVYYFIGQGHWKPDGEEGIAGVVRGEGRISRDAIAAFLPAASEDVLVMVCGPPGMMASISGTKAPDYSQGEVGGALKELGYTKQQVFKF